MTYSTSAFIERCAAIDDIRALQDAARRFFKARGVRHLMYHDESLGPDPAFLGGACHFGIDRVLIRQCMRALGRYPDLLHGAAAKSAAPFFLADIGQYKKLTAGEHAMLARLVRIGLGDVLVVQIYGPNMLDAVVCMGFGSEWPRPAPARIFELQCAAQSAHLRAIGLRASTQSPANVLSPREMEVLRWCARGKSTPVIADILGISRHTVDTLMRRVFEKLNVHDRTGAAIEGLRIGALRLRGAEIV